MKTVVVTGASGGIGSAVAKKFAENGYRVVVGYNTSKDKAQNVVNEINKLSEGFSQKIDLTSRVSIDSFFEYITKTVGKIDVLVNNAGITISKPLIELDYEDLDEVIKTNLTGAIYASKLAVQNMLKYNEGHIINISSIFGIRGGCNETAYSASKSGLTAFTSALAREVGPSDIYINTVAPGAIDTDMNKGWVEDSQKEFFSSSAVRRMGRPEEIADVVFYLASEGSSYINGQTIVVDGGKI